MSKKAGRRRSGPRRGSPRATAHGRMSDAATPTAPEPGAVGVQPGQPPLLVSLARGMRAVAGSPPLLLSSFLAALGLWAALSGYGVNLAASPAAMAQLEALAPLHSFLDLQFLASGHAASGVAALAFGAGLLIARAALLCLWISLILESLEGSGPWSRRLQAPLRRAAISFPAVLALEVGFSALAVAALFLIPNILGPLLGQLGVIAVLLGGMYFLVFAPVAVVLEGAGLRNAAALSVRAARLPGRQQLLLVFAYMALSTFVSIATPVSPVAAATPSFFIWLYVLFVSFLHLSVLGALTYRWTAIRDAVMADRPTASRPRRSLR